MFALDGKPSNFSENDEARRNAIVKLLQEWSLLTIKHSEVIEDLMVPVSHLKIISFKDKPNWNLGSKYNIGHKNKDE